MRIVLACLLTVAIEGAFFCVLGLRSWYAGTVIVCANIITNIVLNLFLSLTGWYSAIPLIILEALVVLAEYWIYSKAFGGSNKLLIQTVIANILSFTIGLLVF
ncbi:MAG: hypothetical protein IJH64_10820 [Oscillospiraceae bacterium]|nr:hypothetical protein [Oscillospiraceae bacterium]